MWGHWLWVLSSKKISHICKINELAEVQIITGAIRVRDNAGKTVSHAATPGTYFPGIGCVCLPVTDFSGEI